MADYLFAYGSLIGSKAQRETEDASKVAVRISGLRRGWDLPVPEDRTTGLGVILDDDAVCNGVLFATHDEHLAVTDAREVQHGYNRTNMPPASLTTLLNSQAKIENVWVYLITNPILPTLECPIAQSYLDVVLTGCLELGEEFAAEFINTTDGWDNVWINDRSQPRYRRAISANNDRIDALLQKVIPNLFARRLNPRP